MTSIRRSVTATCSALAALSVAAVVSTVAAAPAQAGTVDGIDVVTVANYSCSTDLVYVKATSMTPLDGNWPIAARASVYDSGTGQWVTSAWQTADGISDLELPVVQPDTSAWVTYAHFDVEWHYDSEWVPISQDLDNYSVFCD
jgi:hypothetical protein